MFLVTQWQNDNEVVKASLRHARSMAEVHAATSYTIYLNHSNDLNRCTMRESNRAFVVMLFMPFRKDLLPKLASTFLACP